MLDITLAVGMQLLNQLRQRLSGANSLRSQIIIIATSSVVGQMIAAFSAPVVSRLFTPADFGVSAGYSFLLMTILAVNSLRYEYAIPLPKEDSEGRNLVVMTVALVCVLSIVFTGFVWLFAEPIAELLNEPRLMELLPLLPFSLIIGGFLLAVNYWLTRQKLFTTLSQVQIGSNLGQTAAQIGTGIAGLGAFGLAFSFLFGQFVSLIIGARRLLPLKDVQPRTWATLALRYRNFPLYSTAGSLVDIAGTQLPSVLFLAYFSANEAGFFSLTTRVMSLPLGIISNAVGQTLYPRLLELRDDPTALRDRFEKVATALFLFAVTGFGFVLVTGDSFFALVFGNQWHDAGLYAQLLTPYFMLAFITSPLSVLAFVYDQQKQVLIIITSMTALRIAALLVGGAAESAVIAVALFSLASFVIYLVYLVWLMNLVEMRLSVWLWQQRGVIGIAILLVVAGLWARLWLPSLAHILVSGVFVGGFGLMVVRSAFGALK